MKFLPLLTLAALAAQLHAQSEHPTLQVLHSSSLESEGSTSDLSKLIAADSLTDGQLDAMRNDGRWLGANWWANRLQDWSVKGGTYVCEPNRDFLGWRVAHDMTREITGDLDASVNISLKSSKSGLKLADDSVVGFLIGAGHSLDNRLAKALIFDFKAPKKGSKQKWPSAPGSGIAVGISGSGKLRLIDLDTGELLAEASVANAGSNAKLHLTTTRNGSEVMIKLVAKSAKGQADVSASVAASRLVGGLGLLSHPGVKSAKTASLVSTFSDYKVAAGTERNRSLGMNPIAATHYTIDRGVLKLSAQCMPQHKGTKATLSFFRNGKWEKAATETVRPIDELALFRIENWNHSEQLPFRVSIAIDNCDKPATSTGLITSEPTGDNVRLAALGCIIHRPWGQPSNWNEVMYFPHHELQERVLEEKPDIVFFYGDQMYEGTPSYVDKKNYLEDYLYKWLFHCVAFREVIRNVPSITIPDDHDVYQGNYWAQGGRAAPKGNWNFGGYSHPGEFVAQVHRTQTSHLPDAVNPNCMEQNIPAYFCDWNWGGVSFAVLGDRLFKSGPAGKGLPVSGTNRPDHYNNPEFDTADLDLPGLELLGKPQEDFLATWATDWSDGAKMKAVLSQSPFGNFATHHSGTYLIADLDSNGWPQSGRNRALETMRSARAVHIAGDQHLSTMVQHGIQEHNDAVFAFTAPAVSNAYARAYYPSHKGNYYKVTPPTPDQYLGERLDGFKNKMTMLAVANPDVRPEGPYNTVKQPAMNHQVPGFGIVDFNTKDRTTTFHSLPRSYEVAKRLKGGEYPGWPVTVKQQQNDGRKPTGELVRLNVAEGKELPVVSVYGPDNKLQSSQRADSRSFVVHGYTAGEHTVKIGKKVIKANPSKEASVVVID